MSNVKAQSSNEVQSSNEPLFDLEEKPPALRYHRVCKDP
jgi:hypothetical protein